MGTNYAVAYRALDSLRAALEHTEQQRKQQKILDDLRQHTGSCTFTRGFLNKCLYTEGALDLAETCGAYWLLEAIESHQTNKVSRCPFQVWRIEKQPDNSARLTMREDSGQPVVVEQEIPYTDFPLDSYELWAVKNELDKHTVMLKSEY